jgi:hypothetical protein
MAKLRVSAWPRLTVRQREYMRRIDKNNGEIYSTTGNRRTIHSLAYKRLLETFGGSWYHLTQSGKDYIRFDMRRKVTNGAHPSNG